jgi:hypothetical protein
VVKSSDEIYHSWILRFCAHIQQHDVFRIKISAKTLEKPQMRWQFSTVQMFKTSKQL